MSAYTEYLHAIKNHDYERAEEARLGMAWDCRGYNDDHHEDYERVSEERGYCFRKGDDD